MRNARNRSKGGRGGMFVDTTLVIMLIFVAAILIAVGYIAYLVFQLNDKKQQLAALRKTSAAVSVGSLQRQNYGAVRTADSNYTVNKYLTAGAKSDMPASASCSPAALSVGPDNMPSKFDLNGSGVCGNMSSYCGQIGSTLGASYFPNQFWLDDQGCGGGDCCQSSCNPSIVANDSYGNSSMGISYNKQMSGCASCADSCLGGLAPVV